MGQVLYFWMNGTLLLYAMFSLSSSGLILFETPRSLAKKGNLNKVTNVQNFTKITTHDVMRWKSNKRRREWSFIVSKCFLALGNIRFENQINLVTMNCRKILFFQLLSINVYYSRSNIPKS